MTAHAPKPGWPAHQRRMLALDGGGIMGLITLQVLARMEEQLAGVSDRGDKFRLCQFFDYIAGTSTGAIIAAGLAIGKKVSEIVDFYRDAGAEMFEPSALLYRARHLYEADPLRAKLSAVFGAGETLASPTLQSLLLVVTRNATTDSPWPVSSNPAAKYNERKRPDCNLQIPLWQLVRASTAAPIYFPPEQLEWEPGNIKKTFVFEDGGVTPYNNPAWLLFRMATTPAYRLGWETGEDRLMLVSVGTGTSARAMAGHSLRGEFTGTSLTTLPGELMRGMAVENDINCRTIGRCVHGRAIDNELGDLIPRDADGTVIAPSQPLGRAFLYARYDPDVSAKGLAAAGLGGIDAAALTMDNIKMLPALERIGEAEAKHVDLRNQFSTFMPAA
jgi:predicted acylesterase/phospholipase RssA